MHRDLMLFNGSLVDRFQQEFAGLEKLFNETFSNSDSVLGYKQSGFPKCNLIETDKEYILEIAIAGLSKKEIKVEMIRGKLVITGEKKNRHENAKYLFKEISGRSFQKVFQLSDDINQDNIEASFDEGILEIRLPKKSEEEKKSEIKEIKIK